MEPGSSGRAAEVVNRWGRSSAPWCLFPSRISFILWPAMTWNLLRSSVVGMRMALLGAYIWMSGFQLVDSIGRIRKYGIVRGGLWLGVNFEVSKFHAKLSLALSLPAPYWSDMCPKLLPQCYVAAMLSHTETVGKPPDKFLLLLPSCSEYRLGAPCLLTLRAQQQAF